jgi:chromate transporter
LSVNADDAPADTEPSGPPPVSLFAIARMFLTIGALSFGGGITGWVYRDVVLKQKWMTEVEFVTGLALAQALPGGNVTNISVYVGNWLRGIPGAIVALLAILLVPATSTIALLAVYGYFAELSFVRAALDGIAAAAIGLLILISWKTSYEIRASVTGLATMAATFIGISVLHLPFMLIVAVMAPLSIAIAWPRKPTDAE